MRERTLHLVSIRWWHCLTNGGTDDWRHVALTGTTYIQHSQLASRTTCALHKRRMLHSKHAKTRTRRRAQRQTLDHPLHTINHSRANPFCHNHRLHLNFCATLPDIGTQAASLPSPTCRHWACRSIHQNGCIRYIVRSQLVAAQPIRGTPEQSKTVNKWSTSGQRVQGKAGAETCAGQVLLIKAVRNGRY